jgi:hypothetical protein
MGTGFSTVLLAAGAITALGAHATGTRQPVVEPDVGIDGPA